MKLEAIDYNSIYKDLEYAVRMKLRELLDDFIKYPLNEVMPGTKLD